jgi:hypothetical protein
VLIRIRGHRRHLGSSASFDGGVGGSLRHHPLPTRWEGSRGCGSGRTRVLVELKRWRAAVVVVGDLGPNPTSMGCFCAMETKRVCEAVSKGKGV